VVTHPVHRNAWMNMNDLESSPLCVYFGQCGTWDVLIRKPGIPRFNTLRRMSSPYRRGCAAVQDCSNMKMQYEMKPLFELFGIHYIPRSWTTLSELGMHVQWMSASDACFSSHEFVTISLLYICVSLLDIPFLAHYGCSQRGMIVICGDRNDNEMPFCRWFQNLLYKTSLL